MEHKRVKIISCPEKLLFVKAIKESTGKSLLEAKNIAESVVKLNPGGHGYDCGTLLLNESSITPQQWQEITKNVKTLEWEYV